MVTHKAHGDTMNCYKDKNGGGSNKNGILYIAISFSLIIFFTGCAASVLSDKDTKDKKTDYSWYLSEHEKVVDMLSDKVESLSGGDAVALASVLTVVPPKGHEAPFSRVDKFVIYSHGDRAVEDVKADKGAGEVPKSVDVKTEVDTGSVEDKKENEQVKTIWPEYKKK